MKSIREALRELELPKALRYLEHHHRHVRKKKTKRERAHERETARRMRELHEKAK